MREKKLNIICISAIIGLFCLSFVSCKDSDFDLSNIDKTLGFGSDSISVLGSSSTDSIKLSDILKLYDSNFVTILDNGDYSFVKSNDNITPAHPYVDQVSVGGMGSKSLDVNCFSESASAKRYYAKATALSAITRFSDKMEIFGFETEHIPSEIKELNKAYIKSTINVTVTYSDEIVKNISKFQTVVITLPAYLKIGKATYNGTTVTPNANNQIVLNNVETSAKKFTMQFALDALDFDATENIVKSNELTFLQGKKIIMNGYVQVSGTFDASELDPSLDKSKCNIHCDVNYGDITLTGATGKFSPSLTFANFETVNLENIPNFLKDHDVNIDLYNPQVVIKATSDLPLKGIVSGTLTSTFADGSTPVTIEVPQFSINANGTSNICICKNASAITNTYDQIVEIPTLSNLVRKIPKEISFGNINAQCDDSQTGTLEFGKKYTVQPSYKLQAPLAFSSDAQIVYNDTLKDWNKIFKKLTIKNQVRITTDVVNQVPIYLTFSAQAFDLDKNLISTDDISIEVSPTIPAYNPTTGKAGEATLTIIVKQKKEGAFKNMDGILLRAVGAATADGQSPIGGVTLNAYKQKLLLKNINATIIGKIITDFN